MSEQPPKPIHSQSSPPEQSAADMLTFVVRKLRSQSGQAIDETATRAGISRPAAYAIRKGTKDPKYSTVKKLFDALKD